MIDYIAKFAHHYITDESLTEEEMLERLDLAEYYLEIPFDRDGSVDLQYQNMCEFCFKKWDSRPVID